VNGNTDVGPQRIVKGDRVILDSPHWAMEGLGLRRGGGGGGGSSTGRSQATTACSPKKSPQKASSRPQEDPPGGSGASASSGRGPPEMPPVGGQPRSDDTEVVAGFYHREPPPAVEFRQLPVQQQPALPPPVGDPQVGVMVFDPLPPGAAVPVSPTGSGGSPMLAAPAAAAAIARGSDSQESPQPMPEPVYDVVPVGRVADFQAPHVPRLDLTGMQGRVPSRRPRGGCYEDCELPMRSGRDWSRCQLGFAQCGQVWQCL